MKIFLLLSFLLIILTGCSSNNSTNNETIISRTSYSKPLEQEMAFFSTVISSKEEGRQNNIELTCNKLNGVIVNNGEVFSFCDTVGPGTPENGYEKADVLDSDGNVFKGYGGGKCQVSSTLYNVVLHSKGLTVIERHAHSKKVDYVEEGKDATVAYGSLDFKFRNDTGNKIKIYANATENNVNIKIVKIT